MKIPGSVSFIMKTTPTSFLLKRTIGIKSGSSYPSKSTAGSITKEQIRDIAIVKMIDLTAYDINSAIKTISGTAKSMGINLE